MPLRKHVHDGRELGGAHVDADLPKVRRSADEQLEPIGEQHRVDDDRALGRGRSDGGIGHGALVLEIVAYFREPQRFEMALHDTQRRGRLRSPDLPRVAASMRSAYSS